MIPISSILIPALLAVGPIVFPSHPAAAQGAPFALLELFTSEGCSSCPPAERLLSKVAADARRDGRRIFVMELHVDYWNHLGWADPFSSRAYSERQRKYSDALGLSQVYTPQLIVNGVEEFVGSDRRKAESAIVSALARPATVSVELRTSATAAGRQVDYKVSSAPKGSVLCLVLVDSSITTHVGAGENSGRTLVHTNVAREFKSVPLGEHQEGTVTFLVSPSKNKIFRHVIAFVQNPSTLVILGASGS